jgi:hypothetical protein
MSALKRLKFTCEFTIYGNVAGLFYVSDKFMKRMDVTLCIFFYEKLA